MAVIDNIKALCKERGIALSNLENELGFAKGSLAKSTSGISGERILKIAQRFGVPMEYIMTGEDRPYYANKETDELYNEIQDNPELRFLLSATKDLGKDDLEYVINLIKRLRNPEIDSNDVSTCLSLDDFGIAKED